MDDALSPAVDELERKLQDQLAEANNTKKLINSLLKVMGKPERYTDTGIVSGGPVRGDMYYGKAVATAAQMVLERIGHSASAFDILKALTEGGFDFRPLKWGENVRHRNLAISMAKNTKAFHKLPNGTFGLAQWYDEATINASKREKAEKGEDDLATDSAVKAETPDA
jgi:hypothetical protein